jgi:1-deoxy-D-xylulose 5-phosphate reductoisomerase
MDLVKKLLDTSQLNRLTVQQALAHPWFGMDEGVYSC